MSSVLQTCSPWLHMWYGEREIEGKGTRERKRVSSTLLISTYGTYTTNLSWFGDYHRGCRIVSMQTYLRLHCILKNNNQTHDLLHVNMKIAIDSLRLPILQSQMGSTDFQSKSYASPLSAGRSSPVNANMYKMCMHACTCITTLIHIIFNIMT